MGSNAFDLESPFPSLEKIFSSPFFKQEADITIKDGQVTVNKPISLFPVCTIPNSSTPLPPVNDNELKLFAVAKHLGKKAGQLWDLVLTNHYLTQDCSGVVAALQNLSTMASLMSTRAKPGKHSASTIQKAKDLATAANGLALKAARKLGKELPNAENIEPELATKTHDFYMKDGEHRPRCHCLHRLGRLLERQNHPRRAEVEIPV